MKNLYIAALVVAAIFATWFVTRHIYTKRAIEFFTTNFNPGYNLEDEIRGYRYAFGDRRSDSYTYFGFPDDIKTVFSKRLLPDIIPQD